MQLPLIYRLFGLNPSDGVRQARERMLWSREQIGAFQLAKLNALLARIDRSPESRTWLPGLDRVRLPLGSLEDFSAAFPVLEKQQLQLRPPSSRIQSAGIMVQRETAGTSGRVTRVSMGRNVLAAQVAARALSMEWHGVHLGDREGRVWGRKRLASGVTLMERALRRRVVGALETEADRQGAAEFLANFNPVYLYGYSSHIMSLAPAIKSLRSRFPSLRAVFCTAETLLDWQRDEIERQLGVPVLREYGCTELDIIAAECQCRRYHIMVDRCFVELDRNGDGSGEVLITDLDNDKYPIVRYRLGDVASLAEGDCQCGLAWPVIAAVDGRASNRYVRLSDGRHVHAVTFAHMVEGMIAAGLNVRQFRVVQLDLSNLVVRLDLASMAQGDSASAFARAWIAKEVGADIRVDVVVQPIVVQPGIKNHYFQPMNQG